MDDLNLKVARARDEDDEDILVIRFPQGEARVLLAYDPVEAVRDGHVRPWAYAPSRRDGILTYKIWSRLVGVLVLSNRHDPQGFRFRLIAAEDLPVPLDAMALIMEDAISVDDDGTTASSEAGIMGDRRPGRRAIIAGRD